MRSLFVVVVTVPLLSSRAECGNLSISGSFFGEHGGRFLAE